MSAIAKAADATGATAEHTTGGRASTGSEANYGGMSSVIDAFQVIQFGWNIIEGMATVGGPPVDQDINSLSLQRIWLLNGRHKPYKAATGVFGAPKVGESGLWELTARVDNIENEDLVNREASSWILGMNYYVNPALRFMFNFTKGENEFNGDETGQ